MRLLLIVALCAVPACKHTEPDAPLPELEASPVGACDTNDLGWICCPPSTIRRALQRAREAERKAAMCPAPDAGN